MREMKFRLSEDHSLMTTVAAVDAQSIRMFRSLDELSSMARDKSVCGSYVHSIGPEEDGMKVWRKAVEAQKASVLEIVLAPVH